MEEIWKDAKYIGYDGITWDFTGKYLVSNLGNVKSTKGNYLTTHLKKGGYVAVNFFINGKSKELLVSRLVASVFIPKPDNLAFINHINEKKLDNRVSNGMVFKKV